jgi:mannose-1-phosphate guanylyltransferase/mannose-6-phosphate isomerase
MPGKKALNSGEVGTIVPVVMCGGTGTRLWPVSRASLPKQYHSFVGEKTLLQDTVERVAAPGFGPAVLVSSEEHRFIVAEQVASLGCPRGPVVLEPASRNTAPVALVASLLVAAQDPQALVLLLPSDHLIKDADAFRAMVRAAEPAARAGFLCLFGLKPGRAETGYGYIEAGEEAVPTPESPVRRVRRFVEKPDAASAEHMVEAGGFAWNSGIFLFQPAAMIGEAEAHQPEMLALAREAVAGAARDVDFLRLGKAAFERIEGISLDYAIMERTDRAAVLPATLEWSDLGAWDAIHSAHESDEEGNVLLGRTLSMATQNTFVRSERQLVATIGVKDLIVVATDDALLVADRAHAQEVKHVLERLREEGFTEAQTHATIYRPWGAYRSVTSGERFQVKLITVKPGGRLSLQLHHHRAEHWVVVHGTAQITCGEKVFTLYENQSTYIPQGEVHRLENPGRIPLEIIEVQSGSYLGEDDIIRVEDIYGRAPA